MHVWLCEHVNECMCIPSGIVHMCMSEGVTESAFVCMSECVHTLRHGACADKGGHAAVGAVPWLIVAGMNLNLVTGEVFQV